MAPIELLYIEHNMMLINVVRQERSEPVTAVPNQNNKQFTSPLHVLFTRVGVIADPDVVWDIAKELDLMKVGGWNWGRPAETPCDKFL